MCRRLVKHPTLEYDDTERNRMPRLASQKKALRSARARRTRNLITLSALRKTLKRPTKDSINAVYKALDKAAKKGLVTGARAARLKSRAAKIVGATPRRAAPTPAKKKVAVKKKAVVSKKATPRKKLSK